MGLALGAGLVAAAALLGLVNMPSLGAGQVLLMAGAILADERRKGAPGFGASGWVAALVAASSLLFLLGHTTSLALPAEDFLLRHWPGLIQTSPMTDLALLCLALALVSRGAVSGRWGGRQLSALLAFVSLFIGLLDLVTYTSGSRLLYGPMELPMVASSAVCAALLGASQVLAAGRDTWPLVAFRLDHHPSRRGFSPRTAATYLLLGLLILAGGALALRQEVYRTRTEVQGELSTISELKGAQLTRWFAERRGDAEVIAQSALIQEQLERYLSGSSLAPSERDVHDYLASLQASFQYERVALFDAQGRCRVSVPPSRDPEAPVPPEELQRVMGSPAPVMVDLHRERTHGNIHLDLLVPIRRKLGGAPKGGLMIVVDPKVDLLPIIQAWPGVSPTAETLLVRREGDQVVFLNDLRHKPGTALSLRLPLADHPDHPAIQAALGKEGLVEGPDYREVPVVAVVRKVTGTPWLMVNKVDAEEVYGPLRQTVWFGGLGLMGLVLLLGTGMGMRIRHREAEVLRKQLDLTRRYETLMREANDIILMLDGENRVLEANAKAVAQYGYALDEMVGLDVRTLQAPDAPGEGPDGYHHLRQAGDTRFETIHQRKDGTTFPVEVSAKALILDGESRYLLFLRDITVRRAQEQSILRLTQLYSALSQVNQAIVWSKDRETLLSRLCEAMVVFGKFDMAWIALDEEGTGELRVAASHGDAHAYLDQIRVERGPTILGSGPVGRAIREGLPCIVNDFLGTPGTEPWREAALASGFNSVAGFPIRRHAVPVGALTVYSRELGIFGPQEEALLVQAAENISFALEHLDLEDQRRGAELALLESDRQLKEAQEAGGIATYTWFIQADTWKGSAHLDQLFGIGPEHPRTAEGWMAVVAPDHRSKMADYVAGILQRHEPFDLDYPIIRVADGERRWVHGKGEVHYDEQGQPVALVGIIQDITERKLVEQALRKISVAIEQSPLSIVMTDPQGIIEYVNPAFTRTTGYTAQKAIGQNPRLLKSPATPPDQYRAMWETLARGDVWVGEFENLKKGGEPFQERALIAPVRDESGLLTGYIALKEDITQHKKDEAERRSLEAQLHQSQKLESLGSLAGGVAHDMNNVLGAVLGLASTLRSSADPFGPEAKSLDTIVSACMRGRGVVKSLLYFARKDLQEESLIDVNALVGEITQLLSRTTLQRIHLTLDLAEGLGLLRGDPGALSHALMNLCVNAVDAMPQGGELRIRSEAYRDGSLAICVSDSGEGMSPEVLAKAKDPFFTTKPLGKGTGLGLAMVHGTMQAHEGTFDLISQPGEGTEAILHFPAARVAPRTPEALTEGAGEALPDVARRVLLVDDDELIRDSVTPMLEILGHAVTCAASGAKALMLLGGGLKVDLVILDMNMPGMSGAETLPRIRSLCPGLQVILASGYSEQEVAPLLQEFPGVTSLRKPFSMEELQRVIQGLGVLQQDGSPSG